MDLAEINRYLATGSEPYVCISRQYFTDDLNKLREIYIGKDNLVKLEFNTWGYDEGGLIIEFNYADEHSMIASLENFLQIPIENWENFNKIGNYPSEKNYKKMEIF